MPRSVLRIADLKRVEWSGSLGISRISIFPNFELLSFVNLFFKEWFISVELFILQTVSHQPKRKRKSENINQDSEATMCLESPEREINTKLSSDGAFRDLFQQSCKVINFLVDSLEVMWVDVMTTSRRVIKIYVKNFPRLFFYLKQNWKFLLTSVAGTNVGTVSK